MITGLNNHEDNWSCTLDSTPLGVLTQITDYKLHIIICESIVVDLATKLKCLKSVVLRKVLILGTLLSPKFS